MDLSEAELTDTYWDDQVKVIPNGIHILVEDIKKALAGEPFYYFPTIDSIRELSTGIPREHWVHYFSIFHYSEEFGLPNGKGWQDELPWLIPYLYQMRYVKRAIDSDRQAKAAKSRGNQVDSIDAKRFGD